jgi:hypothetical protein
MKPGALMKEEWVEMFDLIEQAGKLCTRRLAAKVMEHDVLGIGQPTWLKYGSSAPGYNYL